MPSPDSVNIPKPISEGTLRFDLVQEGPTGYCRTIAFNPPLLVEYTVWPDEDEKADKTKPTVAYYTFDFGMTGTVALTPDKNWLIRGYEGLSEKSTMEEIIIKDITFDLFHAFCHCEMDPNFTHYHWALLGWLKDRAKVTEED